MDRGVGILNRRFDSLSNVNGVMDRIVVGMVGGGVISIFDLDYKIENIDPLWKLLSYKVKESYDICSISWIPIVVINFPVCFPRYGACTNHFFFSYPFTQPLSYPLGDSI